MDGDGYCSMCSWSRRAPQIAVLLHLLRGNLGWSLACAASVATFLVATWTPLVPPARVARVQNVSAVLMYLTGRMALR